MVALRSDFILVVFGRLATALIAIASLRVMTTMLAPSDYGQWVLLVAFQTFCGLFLINPVDQHVFRHAHAWWDDGTLLCHLSKFDKYIRVVSLYIAVAVVLWSSYKPSEGVNNIGLGLAAGMTVGIIVYFGTWGIVFITLLNVLGFRVQSVLWMIASVLVGLVCSTLFVTQHSHAISWVLGQAFGAAVGALGAWRTLRSHSEKISAYSRDIFFSDFLNRVTILSFCLLLAAATDFMWLQNTGYRFWVGDVWGVAELGILAVGLGVSA